MAEKLDSLGRRRQPKQAATQFQPLRPGEPTVKIEIRVPQSLRDAVDAAATAAGQTRSEFVRAALEQQT